MPAGLVLAKSGGREPQARLRPCLVPENHGTFPPYYVVILTRAGFSSPMVGPLDGKGHIVHILWQRSARDKERTTLDDVVDLRDVTRPVWILAREIHLQDLPFSELSSKTSRNFFSRCCYGFLPKSWGIAVAIVQTVEIHSSPQIVRRSPRICMHSRRTHTRIEWLPASSTRV